MIASFILSLLVAIASADGGPTTDRRPEGGVSGGGGNVISPMPPDRHLDPEHAEGIIEGTVNHVRTYLYDLELDHKNDRVTSAFKPITEKLFDGKKTILNIIDRIEPDVEDERPCYDGQRKPVDGSIYSHKKNTICISAFNLSKKVHRSQLEDQSTALMIHEYSELVGLSEDEAVLLQKKTLEDLSVK